MIRSRFFWLKIFGFMKMRATSFGSYRKYSSWVTRITGMSSSGYISWNRLRKMGTNWDFGCKCKRWVIPQLCQIAGLSRCRQCHLFSWGTGCFWLVSEHKRWKRSVWSKDGNEILISKWELHFVGMIRDYKDWFPWKRVYIIYPYYWWRLSFLL